MQESPSPIILIGGCSSSGKSTLARTLAARLDARLVDTDLFWMVLQRVLPASDDIHLFHSPLGNSEFVWSLQPDELVELYIRVSRSVCRAIEVMVAHYGAIGACAVIEGCWILPDFAVERSYAGRSIDKPPNAVFLHESDYNALEERLLTRKGSPPSSDQSVRNAQLQMQWRFGLELKRRAESLGLPVLEARPFETLVDRTLAAVRVNG